MQECHDVTTKSTPGLAYFEMLQENVYQWLSTEGKVNTSAYCLSKLSFIRVLLSTKRIDKLCSWF